MFYPVVVKSREGKVKETITPEQLKDRHWGQFAKVTKAIRPPLPNTFGNKNTGDKPKK